MDFGPSRTTIAQRGRGSRRSGACCRAGMGCGVRVVRPGNHDLGRHHFHDLGRHHHVRRAGQIEQAHPGGAPRTDGHTFGLHRGERQTGRCGGKDRGRGLAERRPAQGSRGRQTGGFRHDPLQQLGHLLQQGSGAQAARYLRVEHHLPGDRRSRRGQFHRYQGSIARGVAAGQRS